MGRYGDPLLALGPWPGIKALVSSRAGGPGAQHLKFTPYANVSSRRLVDWWTLLALPVPVQDSGGELPVPEKNRTCAGPSCHPVVRPLKLLQQLVNHVKGQSPEHI